MTNDEVTIFIYLPDPVGFRGDVTYKGAKYGYSLKDLTLHIVGAPYQLTLE
jgi:hypothetical protein